MAYFSDPQEVLDFLHDLLEDHKGSLGLAFVGYGDEELLPGYPAAVLTAGEEQRFQSNTQIFGKRYFVDIWVYHALLSQSHKVRTREDMALATAIKNKIHEDYTLGGGIIFGYVSSSLPGVAVRAKSAVVGTRLTWEGEGREMFHGV